MKQLFRLPALLAAMVMAPVLATAQTLVPQPVADGVWAIVGPKTQRNSENLGNNATFGLIETPDGAVLVDPGGSWQGAQDLHKIVKSLTQQPVKFVINTGGQDHRWLGNGYWKSVGATIIASNDALSDHKDRASVQLTMLSQLLGDALKGTNPSYADTTFDETYTLTLGGQTLEIIHQGPAHTPGDSFVWLADKSTVFTGDIVYVERILGVGDQSSITNWPDAFNALAALNPKHLVPGHGSATTLATATKDTYDYLMNLRMKVGAVIEDGGDILAATKIDQSAFEYLEQFENLAGRNAQTAFQQMEWE